MTFDELDGSLQDILKRVEEYDVGGGSNSGTNQGETTEPTPDPTENWDKTKVDPVTSADNVIVPVPKGFVASKASGENTVENGFVIYQGAEDVTDDNLDAAMTTRNQFVWVPVDLEKNPMFWTYNGKDVGQLYNFDKSAETYSKITTFDTNSFREPDVVSWDETTSNYASLKIKNKEGIEVTTAEQFKQMIEDDFQEMKESVEKYGGFYIGRYETGEGEKVVKGVNPLGSKSWYEQYQISKNMINANGIKSSMIWGSQWDQTLIWFDSQGGEKKDYVYDSTGKENYGTKTTGLNPTYAVNNIYDMGGNAFDWTIGAVGTGFRVHRGRR